MKHQDLVMNDLMWPKKQRWSSVMLLFFLGHCHDLFVQDEIQMHAPCHNEELTLVVGAANASRLAMSTQAQEEPRMVWATSLERACTEIPFIPTRTLKQKELVDAMNRWLQRC
jgi:hypothetical protein